MSPVVTGPAEARRASHPASRPSWREPDVGAARQAGGRQHQNEAPHGGDLRAFNRQRQAVVQVEVTSCPSLPPPSFPQGTGEMVWSGVRQGCLCCKSPVVFFCPPPIP